MTIFREQMRNMKKAVVKSLLVALLAVGIIPVARADYAQEVMKDSPLAWWRFQDYSSAGGAAAKGETGRHAGVYLGHTTFEAGVPGIGGKAAKFDGRTACVQVAPHQDLAISELSVEVWIKSKQPWRTKQWPGSATLITKATSGPGSSLDGPVHPRDLAASEGKGERGPAGLVPGGHRVTELGALSAEPGRRLSAGGGDRVFKPTIQADGQSAV